jgi:hypothetical protein
LASLGAKLPDVGKVAESKADICYIESMAAGFSIRTWEQVCQLSYLAGYTALLSRKETFTRLRNVHKEAPYFPLPSRPRNGCWYTFHPSNSISYVPADSIPKGDDCRIPDTVSGIKPRVARKPGSTKFDYTFDPDTIDQSVDLLWITYPYIYYKEDLGCRGFGCVESPRSTPIQAD